MPVKGFLVTILKVGDTSFSGTDCRRPKRGTFSSLPLCFRGVLIGLPLLQCAASALLCGCQNSAASAFGCGLRPPCLYCYAGSARHPVLGPLQLLSSQPLLESSQVIFQPLLLIHIPWHMPHHCVSYIFTLKVQFLSKGFPDKIHWYPGSSHLPSRSSYVFVRYPLRILYTFSEHLPEPGAGLLRAGVDSFLLHSNTYYPCHAFLQFSLAYQFLYLLSPSLEGRDPILDL